MARNPNQAEPVESVHAREQLERRWHTRRKDIVALGHLVTGQRNRLEPYHRWLAYKQAFAPQLVREFDRQAEGWFAELPLLDPFSGSGTVVIEAARLGIPAIGIEALSVLAFLSRERGDLDLSGIPAGLKRPSTKSARSQSPPPLEGMGHPHPGVRPYADLCETDAARVLLLCAAARLHDSDGRPLKQPPPLPEVLANLHDMMAADLEDEPLGPVDVRQGDARNLESIADESCGGLLTSPPYLSRHDYTRITRPLGDLYGHWYPDEVALDDDRALQIKAHPRAREGKLPKVRHPAIQEVIVTLRDRKEMRLARIVHEYFADMKSMLASSARVLIPGAPAWIVIGGAILSDVYIPSDLILAELAESTGFEVRRFCVARDLHRGGRQLGGLTAVAPRETLLMLRRV